MTDHQAPVPGEIEPVTERREFAPDEPCPKCGHDDVSTLYRKNSHEYACRDHRRGFSGDLGRCEVCKDEHFDRHCRRCCYEWREEVVA